MKKPELLAPAGSIEILKAAVFAGADAVYIGGKRFNARQRASNFDDEEILQAVRFCKLYDVKLYVVLNIMIKDSEIQEALEYVSFLYASNVDGLIIQDIGLLNMIKKSYPDLPLHSSTQMFVHELSGVKLLAEEGFDRVVTARELTLEEISYIKANSDCEIKIFNHGAMCICYSGQCYMSSMIGDRSGNRGRCAQPCRKNYSLTVEGKKNRSGHLLSPKDLNTLDSLEDLVKTGADSLKIEGRLKNIDYVYTVVKAYRERLDEIAAGKTKTGNNYDVEKVFNRKYTQGYFYNESPDAENLITSDQNDRSVEIGRVEDIKGYQVYLKLQEDLNIGDGIFIRGKESFGENLSRMYDKKMNPVVSMRKGEHAYMTLRKKAAKGDVMIKTSDKRFDDEVKKAAADDILVKKPLIIKSIFEAGKKPFIQIEYKGFRIEAYGDSEVQEAVRQPMNKERIMEQLSKLKDTPFYAEELNIQVNGAVFLPVSEINSLRRKAIDLLTDEILRNKREKKESQIENLTVCRQKSNKAVTMDIKDKLLSVKVSDLARLKIACQSPADEIIFGGDVDFNLDQYQKAAEICKSAGKKILFAFPRVIRKNYAHILKTNMDKIKEIGPDGVLVNSYEGIAIFGKENFVLEADDTLNVFNSHALEQMKKWKVQNVYVSQELNISEINGLCVPEGLSLSINAHGKKELMILQYDLLTDDFKRKEGYLTDDAGYSFPVYRDDFKRTHILNGKTLCLLDELKSLNMMKKLRLDLTYEGQDEIQEIIGLYGEAMDDSSRSNEIIAGYIHRNKEVLTKGHFKRGVL
ncbi:MAG: U32 family peptidase [Eubacteriaceae bacterium]|nr:U32 family peptidase [Eubacteriaceae bacterium]